MSKTLLGTTSLIIAAVLVIAINILSSATLTSQRLDLTENRVFTLASGTEEILDGLEEPLTLRLYLSAKLATSIPSISSYADRVENLLLEYQRASNGKIRLQFIDPEPFSEEEDRAVGYGLRGVPLSAGGDTLYFGLVGTSSTDDEQVIPFLSESRESLLEYDLTKFVYSLANPSLPAIGLLSSLPVEGAGPQAALRGLSSAPWVIVEQMRELYDVRSLDPAMTSVDDDLDVLVLIHPRGLEDGALYAIDQFVMRGGRVVAFIDPNAEAQPQTGPGGAPMPLGDRRSQIDGLLASWGIELIDDAVVGDLALGLKVRSERGGRLEAFDYPVWLDVPQAQFATDDVITSQVGNISFGTAGALKAVDGASSNFAPLVSTTDQAGTFAVSAVGPGGDPRSLARDLKPAGEAFVLAARVTGTFNSAYSDGAPEGVESESEHVASVSEGNVVIVADTDVLQDRFWVQVQNFLGQRISQPTAGNGNFVIGAVDNLIGSNALISVRNRGASTRPFERINELQLAAESRFREKEQALETRLREAEEALVRLEEAKPAAGAGAALILSDAQAAEIERFTAERLQVRKDLRGVRLELRRDIEKVESWIKFANIGAMPILIALIGLLAGLWQLRRHRARLA